MIGKKVGMTRIFDGYTSVPVSVIEVMPNVVVRVKTQDKDGYDSLQVTIGEKRAGLINKAQAGEFAKAGVTAGEGLWEVPVIHAADGEEIKPGFSITVDSFSEGQFVDVAGISKGKGFAGGVKRHNFKTQDATHGNSLSHRALGSTGQCQDPGRVFKGKKMAGQLGNVRKTVQNLQVVRVNKENNMLLVKGGIPGSSGGYVFIKSAVKKKSKGD